VLELSQANPERGAVASTIWPLSWRLYWHTLGGTWRAFGLSKELWVYGFRRAMLTGMVRMCLALDHLFFGKFRRVSVPAPVILIGHPRSGTTFVHRLLTQTDEFCVFRFWEIMAPSLTLRKFVRKPIQRLIGRGGGSFFPKQVGHSTGAAEVEEEELLFLHTGNTQFITCLSPLAFSDWDFGELVHADDQPEGMKRSAMKFLRGCFQRQILDSGKTRVVAKMNYSAMRIRSMLEEFPDAKFVYIVRSPLECIPSHLTLHRNMFDHMWGIQRVPQRLLQRYYERRYRHNIAFYQYLEEVINSGAIPPDRLLVLPYDVLRTDLAGAMQRVVEFTGLTLSPELQQKIDEQTRAQSSYERAHKNLGLEEFGLSREQIVKDFAPVFAKYGFKTGVDT
jgi:hypothetical protein